MKPIHPLNELELVVALFAALEAGEVDEALALVDPDVEWSPIGLSDRGPLKGREGVAAWFEEFGRQPGRIHVEVDDVFRLGDWVVALGTVDDERDGLGEVSPVGWNLRVAGGHVTRANGYDSWSQTLEGTGAWTDGDASPAKVPALADERPRSPRSVTAGQRHPHRVPSPPSVDDAA